VILHRVYLLFITMYRRDFLVIFKTTYDFSAGNGWCVKWNKYAVWADRRQTHARMLQSGFTRALPLLGRLAANPRSRNPIPGQRICHWANHRKYVFYQSLTHWNYTRDSLIWLNTKVGAGLQSIYTFESWGWQKKPKVYGQVMIEQYTSHRSDTSHGIFHE